jgi:hypothetical protein
MYGFRPLEDRAVTRFYTATHIHLAMQRMHEADTALRDRIASQGEDQTVSFVELSGGNIIPCSPAKVLASNITTLKGHRRMLPIGFQTDFKVRLQKITDAVDGLLRKIKAYPKDGENPKPLKVDLDSVYTLIDLVSPTFTDFEPGYEDTWDPDEYKALVKHLVGNSDSIYLLVRVGRNIARFLDSGAGEFAHAPDNGKVDLAVAKQVAVDVPALILLRQNGEESLGWRGCPFWWPILLAPENTRTTLFAHNR